ncbi:MAG TPA: DUF3307 domain-containing protein [Bacilli bacterium]|nr:DUF3307 domain-containing protein [Bacilli bacterium]
MEWLVGHLVGDYLLQTDWMANHKKEKSWRGELACHVHCLLWTLAVLVFTGWWDGPHIALVYLSHYLLDRTPLVRWYVTAVNQSPPPLWVHILVDNTLHLVFLFLIDKYV